MTYTKSELEEIGARLIVSFAGGDLRHEAVPAGRGPDFLLVGGTAQIGLEITLLQRTDDHSGRSRRAMEGLREQLLAGVRALWLERQGPPIEVRVSFAGHLVPTKASLPSEVARLCAFVTAHLPAANKHLVFTPDWDDPSALPECVARVSIARFDALTQSHWFGTDGSFVPDLAPSDIQSRIDAKERKFDSYSVAAPELWLGIVLDGYRPSGHFTITNAVREARYPTRFTRVFLLDAFRGSVHELEKDRRPEAA